MGLTMNYTGLQYKYGQPKKKKKNSDNVTNLKLGKEFFTASQWVDYKEWLKKQKKKDKPITEPKKKKNQQAKEYKKKKNQKPKVMEVPIVEKPYEELLKDPRWLKKRLHILNTKGYTCLKCGSKDNLQVHHLYYEKNKNGKWKNPWDYPDEALVVLCKDCHMLMHSHT